MILFLSLEVGSYVGEQNSCSWAGGSSLDGKGAEQQPQVLNLCCFFRAGLVLKVLSVHWNLIMLNQGWTKNK